MRSTRRHRRAPIREFLTRQHLSAQGPPYGDTTIPNYGGHAVPPRMLTEMEQHLLEHPPRLLDETVFLPHSADCPPCGCARHCRCFVGAQAPA